MNLLASPSANFSLAADAASLDSSDRTAPVVSSLSYSASLCRRERRED